MTSGPGMIDAIARDAPDFQALRRDLHANPELGFAEERTSALVASTLEQWGIEVHRGLGRTGVVGVIRSGSSPRGLGLRADMDALPLTELNGFPHRSTRPGTMHACGHDGHTAALLAAAKYLAAHRRFDGVVYLVFQPAEEGGGGAREMIRDGLFRRFPMDAIFGLHNWPGLPTGSFALEAGPVMASSNRFTVTIEGRGGHAAMPDLCTDPVLVACQLIQAFQTIVIRDLRPIDPAVISVTTLAAGEAANAIPDSCRFGGTVRTFSLPVLDRIEARMNEIAQGVAAAFGVRCAVDLVRSYPPTINDAALVETGRTAFAAAFGPDSLVAFEPTMAAEDFSFYQQEIPGCYFFIGAGTANGTDGAGHPPVRALHNPYYDFNDALLPRAASAWVHLVDHWFGAGAPNP